MHITPHVEQHFTASAAVRDVVIGMADGLTVPFALAAGSIAMGLGGYLAARTDADHYASQRAIEEREIDEIPEREADEVASVLRGFGLDEAHVQQVVRVIRGDRTRWVDFMMKFELGLERPDPSRARTSASTIAGAYVVGGLIPLSPYFFCRSAHAGLLASVAVTVVALALFGYIKGRFTGQIPPCSAWQTVAVGSLAAAAAFVRARSIGAH